MKEASAKIGGRGGGETGSELKYILKIELTGLLMDWMENVKEKQIFGLMMLRI